MDIKDPNQKFAEALDKTLADEALDERELLDEEKELVRLAKMVKESAPGTEPDEQFAQNLRKRVINEYEHILNGKKVAKSPRLLERGRKALLPRPRRRWAWAAAPLAVVALLAILTSFAMASPGFYEKYVPQPVKNMLEEAEVVKTGDLSVVSTPTGAEVWLNGRSYGSTPAEIASVREGEHTIKLSKEGYETVEQDVSVVVGEKTEVHVNLPIVVQVESDESVTEVTEQFSEQLIFLASDGSLYMSDMASATSSPLASFTLPVRGAVTIDNGSIFYIYEDEDSLNYISELSPSGEQTTLTEFTGNVATPIVISADGSKLAYVGTTTEQTEIHLVDIASQTDEILTTFAEDLVLTTLLGIDGNNIYFVRAEAKGVEVIQFGKVSTSDGSIAEIATPDGVDGNSFVLSPDAGKILARTTSGQPGVFAVGSTELQEFNLKATGPMAWAGNTPAVSLEDGVVLLNLDDSTSRQVFDSGGAIADLAGDREGKGLGILTGAGELVIHDITTDTNQGIDAAPAKLSGFAPAGSWSSGERLYAPDGSVSEETADEISLISELNLSPATTEDILFKGNYAYRVTSDGENMLEVINLSDPANPSLIATLPGGNFPQGISADISGNKIIAVGGRMVIIDISDPANPQVEYNSDSSADKVITNGNTAYVSTPNSLQVYDISGSPSLQGEVSLPGTPYDLDYAEGYVYAATGDSGYVVVSVSNPASPEVVGTKTGKFYSQIALLGDYSYVWGSVPGGSAEVDVFKTASDEIINTVDSGIASGGEAQVAGDKLYSHYPNLLVHTSGEDGALIPLLETPNNAIIKVTGNTEASGDLMLVLSEDTLFVFNAAL